MKKLKKGLLFIFLLITALLTVSCMPETPTEAPEALEGLGEAKM